jgi:DNA invertase Pin-like site-specific DNA recombinase
VATIGYARCSTLAQDLTAQRQALAALGVPADRVYLDRGLTGTSRARPGLDQALAAARAGDTLTVTKLDRLARSVPDADREIRRMHDSGDYNVAEIAALFGVSRPTVYRSLDRTAELPPLPAGTQPVPEVTKYDQLLTRNPGQQ